MSVEWWEGHRHRFEPFVSPLVIEEISRGDRTAAGLRLEKIEGIPLLAITEEVRRLADLYFNAIPVPEKARGDAYHLALAGWHGMDFQVSWNFGHIINPRIRMVLQTINMAQGINTPVICSPEELMEW